jgi:hypothetical protein
MEPQSASATRKGGFRDHRVPIFTNIPKTDAGDRDVPIPAWLCDDIAAMLTVRATGVPGGTAREDYLFVRPTGRPLNVEKFRRTLSAPRCEPPACQRLCAPTTSGTAMQAC